MLYRHAPFIVPAGPMAPTAFNQRSRRRRRLTLPTSFVALGEKIHNICTLVNIWCACNSDRVWNISAVAVYRLERRIQGSRVDQRPSQAINDSNDILVGHRNDHLVRVARSSVDKRFGVEYFVSIVRFFP
jgi:hypothetical protein